MKQFDAMSRRLSHLSVVAIDPRDITKVGPDLFHDSVKFEHQAFTDLCNTLALQYSIIGGKQASDDWDSQHPKAWEKLSQALSQFRDKDGFPGILDTSTSMPRIIRILGRTSPNKPDLLQFLHNGVESSSRFAGAHKKHSLDTIRLDIDRMELVSIFTDTESSITVVRGDTYKVGEMFQFGKSSTLMRPSLLRLICTNGLQVMIPAGLRRLSARTPEAFMNSVARVDPFHEVRSFLIDGAVRLRNTNASVYEALQVATNSIDHKRTLPIDISGIADAYRRYGAIDKELGSKSQSWQRQADSGINAYDLFNIATSNTTHTPMDDESRNKLNLLASKMLTDGPDLTNVPPNPFKFTGNRR